MATFINHGMLLLNNVITKCNIFFHINQDSSLWLLLYRCGWYTEIS